MENSANDLNVYILDIKCPTTFTNTLLNYQFVTVDSFKLS